MARLEIDPRELEPIIKAAVAEALDRMEAERARLDRLGYTEAEAAALLGVRPHVLRDCRRRGEIQASKCGSKIIYQRAELLRFLDKQQIRL